MFTLYFSFPSSCLLCFLWYVIKPAAFWMYGMTLGFGDKGWTLKTWRGRRNVIGSRQVIHGRVCRDNLANHQKRKFFSLYFTNKLIFYLILCDVTIVQNISPNATLLQVFMIVAEESAANRECKLAAVTKTVFLKHGLWK